MAEIIYVGAQVRLQVDYSSNLAQDPIAAPTVTITNASNVTSTLGTATKLRDGVYFYDWTANTLGEYTLHFTATFAVAGTVTTNMAVNVVATSTAITATLEEDYEAFFLYSLDPLFVDAEQFVIMYPDASEIEIVELIYQYSQEAISVMGTTDPTPLMREYVQASVACALERLYDVAGGADESVLQLGDLSITKRASTKSKVTRANAGTWCELAAVLREEMYRFASKSGMRAIVKGDKVIIPMPDRSLQHQEWRLH